MSKNVKNVESLVQVFTFLHFEIAKGHFHCKTITHVSCYTQKVLGLTYVVLFRIKLK